MTLSYFEIFCYIIIVWLLTYIISRILAYCAAILHNWCMMALYDYQLWFDKGTTIKSLYNEISNGETFKMMYETRFTPIFNVCGCLFWLFWEVLFFVFVIIVYIIRLIVYLYELFYVYIYKDYLSKLIKPCYNYITNIDYPNTLFGKIYVFIITLYKDIKNYILNFRIA